jgi:hypothetical protein
MADAAAQRHQQLKNEANKMAMKIPFFTEMIKKMHWISKK